MVLEALRVPIVLAPMGGGPSTPRLAAAVSEAGALGFLASAYLTADQVRCDIAATRTLTSRPFGVNLFVPGSGPADPSAYGSYVDRLRNWAGPRGLELGEPRYGTDEFAEKVELLADEPVAVVSFTFGVPPATAIDRLRRAGSEIWITVTSPAEAAEAVAARPDALVAQGSEAGGHRGSFEDRPDAPDYGLLPLLQLIRAEHEAALVAAGGIATAAGVAAVVAAGAQAAQIGSAFMLCPEAGTSPVHRGALRSQGETALTRAFTGRLARGIRNDFMREHGAAAPVAYPEIHHATAPLRASARKGGDASLVNLWAGEAHALALERPAAEVVAGLAEAVR